MAKAKQSGLHLPSVPIRERRADEYGGDACAYLYATVIALAPAPIFMPPSLPWPDETSQSSGGTHGHTAAISAIGGSPDE